MENNTDKVTCPVCKKVSGSPQGIRRHMAVKHNAQLSVEEKAAAELLTIPAKFRVTHGLSGLKLTAVQALAQTKWHIRTNFLHAEAKARKTKNLAAGQFDEVYLPGKESRWIELPEDRAGR